MGAPTLRTADCELRVPSNDERRTTCDERQKKEPRIRGNPLNAMTPDRYDSGFFLCTVCATR